MEILIISGLSGGGKSKAASFLEDMGFYIVDNMPAGMIMKFAEFCAAGNGRYSRVALVYDVRTADTFDEFLEVLNTLRQQKYNCRLLFLEAEVDAIIKRYKETRRSHPLAEETDSLEQSIALERRMLAPLRARADKIIDTSNLSTAKLKGVLRQMFGRAGTAEGRMEVRVTSFGFKHGVPMEADLIFDARFLPNPYYVTDLRPLTGLDTGVRDYVFQNGQAEEFLKRLWDLVGWLLPRYEEEGKTSLVISVGCTGGHHRSVAIAHTLAEKIRAQGWPVAESHRDMGRT